MYCSIKVRREMGEDMYLMPEPLKTYMVYNTDHVLILLKHKFIIGG